MLRRNFITAAIGSISALFTGNAKAASVGLPMDKYERWEAELAIARAANGGRLKTFADLPDENTKWRMEAPMPFVWNGENCDLTLSAPSSADVYRQLHTDGDCVFIGTYIAPKGKKVRPHARVAQLMADASQDHDARTPAKSSGAALEPVD